MAESIVRSGETKISVIRSTLNDICLGTRVTSSSRSTPAPPRRLSEDSDTGLIEDNSQQITNPDELLTEEPEDLDENYLIPLKPAPSTLPEFNFLPPFSLDFGSFTSSQEAGPQGQPSGLLPILDNSTSSTSSERTVVESDKGRIGDASRTKTHGRTQPQKSLPVVLSGESNSKRDHLAFAAANDQQGRAQSHPDKIQPSTLDPSDPSSSRTRRSQTQIRDLDPDRHSFTSLEVIAWEAAGSDSKIKNLTGFVDREQRCIGRGTFGEVYRGKWKPGAAEEREYPNVAVKVLLCPGSIDGKVPPKQFKVCQPFGRVLGISQYDRHYGEN
jgi:hypothetical protein